VELALDGGRTALALFGIEARAIMRMVRHAPQKLVIHLAIEHKAQIRRRLAQSLGELALDHVVLAKLRFAADFTAPPGEAKRERNSRQGLYQHRPSYTPLTVRESQMRTKSMIVWPSAMRLGTSANSGAALPITMVVACASTSATLGTMSREMCGILFRM
jgi:hypothetical protein